MNPNLNRGSGIVPPNLGHQHQDIIQQQNANSTQSMGLRISGSAAVNHHTTYAPPQSVSGVYTAQQQQPSVHAQHKKLQIAYARSYLERVRQLFAQTPEKLNEFLEVMKDFKSQAINSHQHKKQQITRVILHVSGLFRDCPDLICELNTFLPHGFHVEVDMAADRIEITEPGGTFVIDNGSSFPPSVAQQQQQLQQIVALDDQHIIQQTGVTALQHKQQASLLAIDVATPQSQRQPIHFDQALGYLNKVKERFVNTPAVYHKFLDILSDYQSVDGSTKLTESGVYQEVDKLFHNEADLMRDFKSFLPDACLEGPTKIYFNQTSKSAAGTDVTGVESANSAAMTSSSTNGSANKRSMQSTSEPIAAKKSKAQSNIVYDMPLKDVLKDIPLKSFAFFQKLHNAIRSETNMQTFFKFLALYTKSICTKNDLLELVTPFLSFFPELLKEFKDILGSKEKIARQPNSQVPVEQLLPAEKEAHQIDYTHSKRMGVNYRRNEGELPICSGRTELCKQVLNDRWVCEKHQSFTTSEESLSEKKMGHIEDQRFEVDILIETNSSAISALAYAHSKIVSLEKEEAQKWMTENKSQLGCSYTVISRAVWKLYGEQANNILLALTENPLIAVPQLLFRMRARDTEWKQFRDGYNAIWRKEVEKHYLKSLDHQGPNFKANDGKNIRSDALIDQLEAVYEERREKEERGLTPERGPHMLMEYPDDMQLFTDANELISHYVNRNRKLSAEDKKGIDDLLQQMLPRLFMLNLEPFPSADQTAEETMVPSSDIAKEGGREKNVGSSPRDDAHQQRQGRRCRTMQSEANGKDDDNVIVINEHVVHVSTTSSSTQQKQPEIKHFIFFGTESWLLFLRLHIMLATRLGIIKKRTEEMVQEYNNELKFRERQTEAFKKHGNTTEARLLNAVDVQLGLRELKKPLQNPENFYRIMLQMMKNRLDGPIGSNQLTIDFEDTLRTMFDIKAYVLFTMDTLICTIIMHLKKVISDATSVKCLKLLNEYYAKRITDCQSGDLAKRASNDYEEAAEKLLINQNCYKMFFLSASNNRILATVELIDTNEPDSDSGEDEEEK